MEQLFPFTGGSATFPLFPGKYRITLAEPMGSTPGDVLKGTIDIQEFAWGFINVGTPAGFNAGRTDFRIRTNVQAELVMATPGDASYPGYMSGYEEHEIHYRGYVFTDPVWSTELNIEAGYAKVEVLEQYEPSKDLFHLKSYYDAGEHLEIVMPNNQTRNKVEYRLNGVWREVYVGRDTIFKVDTSRTNKTGQVRWKVEIDGQFVVVGESRLFTVGGKAELEATVNISAGNRFMGIMDIVPPPYITHQLPPEKDALVRKKAPHVNYGMQSILTIGHSDVQSEDFKTYMSFKLDGVPTEEEIDKAKLVLSLTQEHSSVNVKIYETPDDWFENTVRWENMPEVGMLIHQETAVPNRHRKIEVDLTSYVTDWYLNGGEQRSFALVLEQNIDGITTMSEEEIVNFSSKESSFPPLLEVSYYKIPPNAGVYYLDAEVLVSIAESSTLDAFVDIQSQFVAGALDVDVLFEAKPGDLEMDADALVSVVELSDLLVEAEFPKKEQTLEMDTDVYVRGFVVETLDSDALLEKKARSTELDVDLVIAVHDESELEADLEIEIKFMESELDVDMLLRAYDFSDLEASSYFEAKYFGHQIDADVEIRAYGDLEMPVELEFVAKTGYTEIPAEAEFFVKPAFDILDADMILSIRWASELDVDLEVEVKQNSTYAFIL
jgi:hypothetical protein